MATVPRPALPPTDAQLGALVTALLAASEGRSLLTVAEAARALGVRAGFLYAHQERLGALRLAEGSKAPIRFEARTLAERILALARAAPAAPPPPRRRRTRSPAKGRSEPDLLPVHDRFAAARPRRSEG